MSSIAAAFLDKSPAGGYNKIIRECSARSPPKNVSATRRKVQTMATFAQKEEKTERIVQKLKELYPEAACALEYRGEGWKLLVMGRLSAQCTDKRVNLVCEELFRRYPTCRALADGELSDIEALVRSCGCYRLKAANIKDSCAILCEKYGGEVPIEMDELLALPGVGRKIANLLRGDLYHLPAIVADTHCIRLCERFGLTPDGCHDPVVTERVMAELVPPEEQSDFCHRLVLFGRDCCTARTPACTTCPLADECKLPAQKFASGSTKNPEPIRKKEKDT